MKTRVKAITIGVIGVGSGEKKNPSARRMAYTYRLLCFSQLTVTSLAFTRKAITRGS